MNVFVAANRKAIAGIATVFLLAGVTAGAISLANPNFVSSFSANAAEVVTGQTSAVSVVVDSTKTSVGAFAK